MSYSVERMAYSVPMTYQSLRYLDKKRFGRMLGNLQEGLYLRMVHGIHKRKNGGLSECR